MGLPGPAAKYWDPKKRVGIGFLHPKYRLGHELASPPPVGVAGCGLITPRTPPVWWILARAQRSSAASIYMGTLAKNQDCSTRKQSRWFIYQFFIYQYRPVQNNQDFPHLPVYTGKSEALEVPNVVQNRNLHLRSFFHVHARDAPV